MSGGEFVREGERETDLKLLVEVGCDPDDTQCALLRENLGGIEHVRRRRAGEGGTRGGRSVSLGEGAGGAAKIKVATWRERSGTSDNVQGYESPPSIGVAVTVFGCGGSWEDVRGTSGVPLPPVSSVPPVAGARHGRRGNSPPHTKMKRALRVNHKHLMNIKGE